MDLLLIQIDGLGLARLHEALAGGHMPRLAERLQAGWLHLRPARADLPSGTLAYQLGLLYGRQDLAPGTRWWDRRAGVLVDATKPRSLKRLEAGISSGHRGLLEGGSAYGSSVAGGASVANLSLAGLAGPRPALARTLRRAPLRIWGATLADVPRHGLSPSLARRLFTELAAADLRDGVPAVLCNFFGPDMLGHRFGPDSPEVLAYLRQADADIEQLLSAAEHAAPPRATVLFSDHGQHRSRPFRAAYGLSLATLVAEVLKATAAAEPPHATPLVLGSGNLAHVYLSSGAPLLHDDVDARWPGLTGVLRRHPGIGLLAGRAAGGALVVGTGGALCALQAHEPPPAKLALGLQGPELLDRLRDLLAQEDCGDLVLFGAEVDGALVSFLDQQGCHNGYLGGQRDAFVASSPSVELHIPPSGVASSLHRQLCALRFGPEARRDVPRPGGQLS